VIIEQLLRDRDSIIRYGGVYAVGLAYIGTSDNNAIKFVHRSVPSVVSVDDVPLIMYCLGVTGSCCTWRSRMCRTTCAEPAWPAWASCVSATPRPCPSWWASWPRASTRTCVTARAWRSASLALVRYVDISLMPIPVQRV
jgi:hypothetical protein